MASFEAQVDAFILKTKARMVAVVQGSIADTITEANTPTAKGGKMRVQTGFLRASGRISFNGMPSGPSRNPSNSTKSEIFFPDSNAVSAGLLSAKIGTVIYFGWSANYAKHREVFDGFLESALMNWQSTVDKNVRKVKAKIR
jgi:hypothetical protein